jgi:hypothetical protein
MPTNEPAIVEELRKAVDGLLYPSESDEPFEVIVWPAAPGTASDQIMAHAPGPAIGEGSVAEFFDELKTSEDAQRFANLRAMLESSLVELGIFRVGAGAEIGVYIVGRLTGGEWAGLRTMSVET